MSPHQANPSGGLHVTLARNISGLDLPESIYMDETFSDPNPATYQTIDETAILLARDLRNAYIESVKKAEEQRGRDDYITESEDECDDDDKDGHILVM